MFHDDLVAEIGPILLMGNWLPAFNDSIYPVTDLIDAMDITVSASHESPEVPGIQDHVSCLKVAVLKQVVFKDE